MPAVSHTQTTHDFNLILSSRESSRHQFITSIVYCNDWRRYSQRVLPKRLACDLTACHKTFCDQMYLYECQAFTTESLTSLLMSNLCWFLSGIRWWPILPAVTDLFKNWICTHSTVTSACLLPPLFCARSPVARKFGQRRVGVPVNVLLRFRPHARRNISGDPKHQQVSDGYLLFYVKWRRKINYLYIVLFISIQYFSLYIYSIYCTKNYRYHM